MTALILDAIPGPVWAALGGLVAIFVAWVTGRRSGAQAAKTDALQADAKANEAGRDAAGKAKDDLRAGKLPEDIARSNDGRW